MNPWIIWKLMAKISWILNSQETSRWFLWFNSIRNTLRQDQKQHMRMSRKSGYMILHWDSCYSSIVFSFASPKATSCALFKHSPSPPFSITPYWNSMALTWSQCYLLIANLLRNCLMIKIRNISSQSIQYFTKIKSRKIPIRRSFTTDQPLAVQYD